MFKKRILFFPIMVLLSFSISFKAQAENNQKEKFIYDSRGKKDPFYPLSDRPKEKKNDETDDDLSPKEKLKQKGIFVSSIVWDPNNPAILIGDNILEASSIRPTETVRFPYIIDIPGPGMYQIDFSVPVDEDADIRSEVERALGTANGSQAGSPQAYYSDLIVLNVG